MSFVHSLELLFIRQKDKGNIFCVFTDEIILKLMPAKQKVGTEACLPLGNHLFF